ncbi:GNAT family N-acetyltransferase [Tissierella sp.]|uniref:GNAT family N-acetyltransferase n=1 Tax=Tissierella sp. TaxID=41274 RepID=UPI0028545C33|nr:GNAT family N-acetyltransferase [Tissierella sp.]MDR7856601.1 GNAT family N-acetyltransferase [Tissierella sp.]
MHNGIYFEKYLSEADFEYYLQLVLNEKVMVMNYGRVFSLEEANLTYKGILKNNVKHEDFGYFKVFNKNKNIFIGLGSITINNELTESEIEYMILPEYWGQGYGSKIIYELLKKAEKIKTIKKVIAITDPNNLASKQILVKNGFISCKVFEIDDGSIVEEFSKEIIHIV